MMPLTVNPSAPEPIDARRETTPLPVAAASVESKCSGNCPDCKRRAAQRSAAETEGAR